MNTSTQGKARVCPPDIRHSGRSKFGFFPPRGTDEGPAAVWRMTIARFHSLSPRASAGRKRRAERRGDAPPGPAALPRTNARREARQAIQLSRPGAAARRRRRRMTRRRRRPRGETRARRRGVRRFLCHLRGGSVGFGGRGVGVGRVVGVSRALNSDGKEERAGRRRLALRRAARRAMPSLRRAAPSSLPVRVPSTSPGCRRRVLDREPRAPRVREPRPRGSPARLARGVSRYPPPTPKPRPARKTDTRPRRDTPRLFEARVPRAPRSRRTLSPPTRHR